MIAALGGWDSHLYPHRGLGMRMWRWGRGVDGWVGVLVTRIVFAG